SQASSAATSKSDKRVLSWQKDVAQSLTGSSVAPSSSGGSMMMVPANLPIRTHGGGGASVAPSSISSGTTITPANMLIRTHGAGGASAVSAAPPASIAPSQSIS